MSQRVTYFFFHSLFRDFPLRFRSTPWGRRAPDINRTSARSRLPRRALLSQRPHTSPSLPHKRLSFVGDSVPQNRSPLPLWGTGDGGTLPRGPLGLPAGGSIHSCPGHRPNPGSKPRSCLRTAAPWGSPFFSPVDRAEAAPSPGQRKAAARGTLMLSPDTSWHPCRDVPYPVSSHPPANKSWPNRCQ